jgi:deazaflavin-dependent oxidoreductase (nitroreductase family)
MMSDSNVHGSNFGKWWFRLENGILKLILRAGVKLGPTYILNVKGRKTGAMHSTPVIVVETGGERYLVAPYGPVNWVRNARSAGSVSLRRGGRSEALHVVEVGPEESAPILKKYVRIASATRRYFHARPDSPVQDFVAEAPGHPVFRLVV